MIIPIFTDKLSQSEHDMTKVTELPNKTRIQIYTRLTPKPLLFLLLANKNKV